MKAQNLVGGIWDDNSQANTYKTVNPITKASLPTNFQEASKQQIQISVNKASEAFDLYSSISFAERIKFLSSIKSGLLKKSDKILETFQNESALPKSRAEGEFQRTVNQIENFVTLLEEGSFIKPIIHTGGPDLRKMLNPIGPVAVFGASNFPLAFSTAGGDTISALAAGCPVIVKAHPYHSGTSTIVAEVINNALLNSDLPVEIFSHLGGTSNSVGSNLVSHPLIKAVGFTGSFQGGKALYDLAQNRSEPIPVFAEMGSINPIFITEKYLLEDNKLPANLAQSISLGTGQFCTNPGMIIYCDSENKSDISKQVYELLCDALLPPMVHINIENNYKLKLKNLKKNNHVKLMGISDNNSSLATISAQQLIENTYLFEEIFGPFSLVVHCNSLNEMNKIASLIPGQLTATILAKKSDFSNISSIVKILKNKVGRLLFEGVPTGVAINQAMNHGGPYPASTDVRYTSVGTDSIYRWLRPISFQDCPDSFLPPALQNVNPLGINRVVNGIQTKTEL